MFDFGKISSFFRLERGLLQVTIGNISASVIGAVFWLLMASIMVPENYGRLTYYLSIAPFVSVISLLGLQNTVMMLLSREKQDIKYSANFLVLISNLIMIPFLLLLIDYPQIVLLVIGMSFFTMSWAELLGNRNYKKYARTIILQRSTQVVLSLTLFFVLGIDGIIFGYAISVILFSYNFFKRSNWSSLKWQGLRKDRSVIVHNYAASLSIGITNFADKIIIGPLFGFAILGLYQISFQFLLFLSVIPVSIFQFLLPSETKVAESKNTILVVFIIASFIAIISYFLVPSAIQLLFPHFIESTESAAKLMILGLIPMTANSIMTSRLLRKGKSTAVFIASVSYISILSSLFFILGEKLGLTGLAIALLVSLVLQSIILFAFDRFKGKLRQNISD